MGFIPSLKDIHMLLHLLHSFSPPFLILPSGTLLSSYSSSFSFRGNERYHKMLHIMHPAMWITRCHPHCACKWPGWGDNTQYLCSRSHAVISKACPSEVTFGPRRGQWICATKCWASEGENILPHPSFCEARETEKDEEEEKRGGDSRGDKW